MRRLPLTSMKAGLDCSHSQWRKRNLNDYLCQKFQCKKQNGCNCAEEYEEKNKDRIKKHVKIKNMYIRDGKLFVQT